MNQWSHSARIFLLAALAAAVPAPAPQTLQAAGREGFESAEISWRLADYDGNAKLIEHARDFTLARSGQGCEHIRLWANQGTYAHLAHPVEPAPIIDELVPSVWVKANRPGLQILARVVLPRSKDKEGKPITVLLGGDFYQQGSTWQQLRVRGIAKLLASAVIRYRVQFPALDPNEAYLDHIVINGYGGPGVTDILFDDLEVEGLAITGRTITPVAFRQAATSSPTVVAASGDAASGDAASGASPKSRVELRRAVIVADSRPLFARAIEHSGESFRWLKNLGFNTVWLRAAASRAQLAEAEEAEVWLVCPPPPQLEASGITDEHRQVLAWAIDPGLDRESESEAVKTVTLIRRVDPARRPIVAVADSGQSPLAAVADVPLLGQRLFGTTFDIKNYGPWLRDATRNSTDRPFWGQVQTELPPPLQRQFSLGRIDAPEVPPAFEQIRLAAFTTVAAGARGVCFRSQSRLDSNQQASVLRAKMLQLVNAELSLLAPWAAGAESKQVPTSPTDTRLTLMEVERSRMLVAIRHGANEQYEPEPRDAVPLALPPHVARVTDNAYLLTPNGLQALRATQSAGSPITLRDPNRVSLILLTQDPLAISRVGRDLSAIRNDHAQLSYELAKHQLESTVETLRQIDRADAQSMKKLEQARAILERGEQSLRGGDLLRARQAARNAGRHVQQIRRTTWDLEVQNFTSPASSPLCASFATLTLHSAAAKYFEAGSWSENLLPAADFESLNALLRSGWRQEHSARSSGLGLVELTPSEPAAGRSALRLVIPAGDLSTNEQASTFSLISPPIPVRARQVIRIQGWVDVPGLIADKRDRLMIADSMNGEDLAERITTTRGWQEFTLYRVCPTDGDLHLTFRMLTAGEARLDDISVSVLR